MASPATETPDTAQPDTAQPDTAQPDAASLDAATDEALRACRAMGRDASSEEVADARARADTLIRRSRERGVTGDMIRRDRDKMRAMAGALGAPVPRILFPHMVECGAGSPEEKEAWGAALEKIIPPPEKGTGCIRVDFRGGKETAFLVLDRCGADHDLGAELEKIYSRVPPEKQGEIRKHLSVLLLMGRAAYFQLFSANSDLLEEIAGRLPEGFDYRMLTVDRANTTLCLPPPCTTRVGMFVRLASELGDGGTD